MKKYIVVSLLLLFAIIGFAPQVGAASGFNPGRIIDDNVFTNKYSMSYLDIQNFLDSKVPQCNTNGIQPNNYTQKTFVCLKDYSENGKSAAQIIYEISQAYTINPQVLIVLLQKEQSLITDTWPLDIQYKTATGYGCPDTAACDSQYFGLTNQLTWSAKMFRSILNNSPGWYTPYILGNNYIQYNPTASCGGSTVNIENRSTQALYNYTPYQPNQGALDAGWGQAQCGAYGNRNFYLYFTSWFGPTQGPNFAWQPTVQEIFTDQSLTTPANADKLAPNTTYYLRTKATNLGNSTWEKTGTHPTLLAATNPSNRSSVFCDNSWVNCSRPSALQEPSVKQGETGTFIHSIKTPASYGAFKEYFNLVSEGAAWFNDVGMYWQFNVVAPTPAWQPIMQEVYVDEARTKVANVSALAPGTTYFTRTQARNTGNTTWSNTGSNPVRLAASSPQDRNSAFADSSWISGSRATVLKEASVSPGSVGTFEFSIKTPNSPQAYNEYFRPVVEGSAWMNDAGFHWPFIVSSPIALWSVVSQNAYTSEAKDTRYNTNVTTNKSRIYLSIEARNTGNTTWSNTGSSPVRLGTNGPQDRTSEFYDSSWLSGNRATTLKESAVAPGDIGTFEFWLTAPYKKNGEIFKESFRPVVEGEMWMNDIGMYHPFTFATPDTSWEYVSQGAYTNSSLSTAVNLTSASRNTTYYLQLKARNTSGLTWLQSSTLLGTNGPQDRSSVVYTSDWIGTNRAARIKESIVNPGEFATFNFTIKTPNATSSLKEYFRPVVEGKAWLTDVGLYWDIRTN